MPTLFRFWIIRPGIEPMYVRRWPRISASSRTPPSDMRTNLRLVALRDRLAERGLADARRSDQAQDRALHLLHALLHGEIFDDAFLDLLQAEVIGVEHFFGGLAESLRTLLRFFHGTPTSQSM